MDIQKTINVRGSLIDLSTPRIMGIINITPDSFYRESRKSEIKSILTQAEKMLSEGATFIDIGGYSSRPGATDIPTEEEIERIAHPIYEIKREFPELIISVDTFRSNVAKAAVDLGAEIINDISGGDLDEKMFETTAKLQVPYIMMHMRGTPQTMKELTTYDDLLKEIADSFVRKISTLKKLGLKDIIIDPGFGFAKSISQNFELLAQMDYLLQVGHPVLAGLSRKSMIYKSLNIDPSEALNGTTVLNTVALLGGASILRVHDVKEASEAIQLIKLLRD
ncbi:dihydropteroate synthase [Marinoscillum sp. MHG1-6]|uniref:dihydropteroate synthase n=1 Tax=Marinoscillum sp. MHG1-6 TaxID=2959627 RepID=UPI00280A7B7D|nr:dihydropteroate synthase [Marinoscillum sp. MHG1-6]